MSRAVPAEAAAADSDLDTESKRPAVKNSLSQIENVVKELRVLEVVADEYPELKHQVGELKRIGKVVEKLISKANPEKPPPPDDGESLDQPEWAALENDDDKLTKNANESLDENQMKCLLCLVEFPEKMAIKKRPLIYWWIAEGLIRAPATAITEENGQQTTVTAEQVGEQVFQKLIKCHCIRPSSSSSFMVYPWVHRKKADLVPKPPNGNSDPVSQEPLKNDRIRSTSFMAYLRPHRNQTDRRSTEPPNGNTRVFLKRKDDNDQAQNQDPPPSTVVNLNNQYLGTKLEWPNSAVLQLGRWQDSATYHIEVEDYRTFLDGLDSQRHLKYLSLRGISRIETLPRSIKKLAALQILDLRACHNLENLPSGISELKNLTHLDVSECYLLDSMPKGIESLSLLQVLKGFVVSSSGRKSCKIADLDRLSYLRKLTIRLGNAKQQLPSFTKFVALRILAISWSVAGPAASLVLPNELRKLDLRSVPFEKVPDWLKPAKLPTNLEKLYIKGGKLRDLNHYDYGNVKFLRLGYLKGLEKNH